LNLEAPRAAARAKRSLRSFSFCRKRICKAISNKASFSVTCSFRKGARFHAILSVLFSTSFNGCSILHVPSPIAIALGCLPLTPRPPAASCPGTLTTIAPMPPAPNTSVEAARPTKDDDAARLPLSSERSGEKKRCGSDVRKSQRETVDHVSNRKVGLHF
jgi:hypothetical protein